MPHPQVKVKGQKCGCEYEMGSHPLAWSEYTCRKCGKPTNLLVMPNDPAPIPKKYRK